MNTSKAVQVVLLGASAYLTACGASIDKGTAPTPVAIGGDDRLGTIGDLCVMRVTDTKVAAVDVADGATLAFTTATGDVAQLRLRVRRMAADHAEHRDIDGTLLGGEHGSGGRASAGPTTSDGMTMPASTVAVQDTDGGAILAFRPAEQAQLEMLRQHLRKRADWLGKGSCPMTSRGVRVPAPTMSRAAH